MTTLILILAAGTMLLLAVVMALVLGWANRAFHVEVNPLVEKALALLPGANCGGCGFVGCGEYAEAVVHGKAAPDKCPVGGETCAQELAALLGIDLKPTFPYRPVVHCGATYADRLGRTPYRGRKTCASANLVAGVQGCTYGCLGFGDCRTACRFDALEIRDGLAVVDYEKCTGCGACAKVCPRNLITMVPFKADRMYVVACSNQDFGKDVKAVCNVGCIGCKACMRLAPELFNVTDNIARIDYDKYDPEKMEQVVLALQKCPTKRIVPMGKPSPKDLEAVKDEHLPKHPIQADFKTTVDKTEWKG